MSSILKALKKLEDESPSPVVDQFWLNSADEKETGHERLKDHFIKYHRIYGTLALLLLLLAAAAALKSKFGIVQRPPESSTSSEQRTATTATLTPLPENESPVPPDAKSLENIKPQIPETRRKETFGLLAARPENTKDIDRPLKKADQPTTVVSETPAVDSRQPDGHLSASKSLATQPDLKPEVERHELKEISDLQPLRLPEPDRFNNAEILPDPNVELQAISWSENTENRLAVINSKIVRSGDRIGNYIVFKINPDDVIVRQGEDLWKIPFKLK